MIRHLMLLAVLFTQLARSRRDLLLENLALRQQLGVFKRKHNSRDSQFLIGCFG
jgi:hypothetical protein